MIRNNKYHIKSNEMQTKITTQKFNQRDGIFAKKKKGQFFFCQITRDSYEI